MKFKDMDKKLIFIVIISLVATYNAAYLTNLAYSIDASKELVFGGGNAISSVCDLNSTFSCSTIFKEDFAWMFGIPFSLIALFVYPIIVIIALLGLFKKIVSHYKWILAMAIGGIIFNGYIIVNEYIIGVYCLLCLICTGIIIINGGLAWKGLKDKQKNKS